MLIRATPVNTNSSVFATFKGLYHLSRGYRLRLLNILLTTNGSIHNAVRIQKESMFILGFIFFLIRLYYLFWGLCT